MRRTLEERAAEAEAKAAKLRADADRRLSTVSDPLCGLLWDAEKSVRACESYTGPDTGRATLKDMADALAFMREQRWIGLKEARSGTARNP